MNELEPLAKALRRELGDPPEAWQQEQRLRMLKVVDNVPVQPAFARRAPLFAAAVALVALVAVAWGWPRERSSEREERWLTAEAHAKPFRFGDGSTIALASGARGHLVTDASLVHFELQAGRANFEVTPGQGRTWTIAAGKNEVTVTGTRFSVSYTPSLEFEVQVERGAVSVRVPERSTRVDLKAGEQLQSHLGQLTVTRSDAKTPPPTVTKEAGDEATKPQAESSSGPIPQPSEPASPRNAPWRDLYRDGKYAESLELLRASGLPERLSNVGPRALAEVADVARLGGDLDLAVRALTLLMQRFPAAPEARDGNFLLGRVHALRGDRATAIAAFEAYLKRGASVRYGNESIGRLMELYSARGEVERAREMARRYLDSAPNGPYRRLASSLIHN